MSTGIKEVKMFGSGEFEIQCDEEQVMSDFRYD